MSEERPEDLFRTRSPFQSPYLWFGLLLVPVVLSLLNSLLSGPQQAAPQAPPERPAVRVAPAVSGDVVIRGGETMKAGQSQSAPASAPVGDTGCNFETYTGVKLTRDLYDRFLLLQRPVNLYQDVGQKAPTREPARINIYLNHIKQITRIACG